MACFLLSAAAIVDIWRPDALAALVLIPPWCWLLVGTASTFVLWRMRCRRAAGTLAVLWLIFAIGWVEELTSVSRQVLRARTRLDVPKERRVRIVSLNCAGTAACWADLKRAEPDLILLQEAPSEDELARMSRELFGDTGDFLAGGDTALLARGTIERQFVDRTAQFVVGTISLNKDRRLVCVSLRLTPPPGRLDFWAGEFWNEHRALRNTHRHQLQAIVAKVRQIAREDAVVIGGDFNTTPLDRSLDELRPDFADAFSSSGRGWGATGTNAWPLFRVDQIWSNARLTPVRLHAETTVHSDHRMVVLDSDIRD